MNLSSSSKKLIQPLSPGEVTHFLAGLERQKEELGPIAAELIDLLRHVGVDLRAERSPSVKPCDE